MMEKLLSVFTPLVVVLSAILSRWLLLLTPLILYFLFKRYEFKLPKEVALKIFDFNLSFLILLFLFGLINSGLLIVARDADVVIPLVSSGLAKQLVVLLALSYYLIVLLFFIGFAFRGKLFSPPLSLKIIETVRGKSRESL
ncbi:MAG: hypothetical protein ABW096_14455 [Candidatus Thiodiazotropha sp.]